MGRLNIFIESTPSIFIGEAEFILLSSVVLLLFRSGLLSFITFLVRGEDIERSQDSQRAATVAEMLVRGDGMLPGIMEFFGRGNRALMRNKRKERYPLDAADRRSTSWPRRKFFSSRRLPYFHQHGEKYVRDAHRNKRARRMMTIYVVGFFMLFLQIALQPILLSKIPRKNREIPVAKADNLFAMFDSDGDKFVYSASDEAEVLSFDDPLPKGRELKADSVFVCTNRGKTIVGSPQTVVKRSYELCFLFKKNATGEKIGNATVPVDPEPILRHTENGEPVDIYLGLFFQSHGRIFHANPRVRRSIAEGIREETKDNNFGSWRGMVSSVVKYSTGTRCISSLLRDVPELVEGIELERQFLHIENKWFVGVCIFIAIVALLNLFKFFIGYSESSTVAALRMIGTFGKYVDVSTALPSDLIGVKGVRRIRNDYGWHITFEDPSTTETSQTHPKLSLLRECLLHDGQQTAAWIIAVCKKMTLAGLRVEQAPSRYTIKLAPGGAEWKMNIESNELDVRKSGPLVPQGYTKRARRYMYDGARAEEAEGTVRDTLIAAYTLDIVCWGSADNVDFGSIAKTVRDIACFAER